MTHTEQFIEDVKKADPLLFDELGRQIELYLINPKAWQAVGEARGWDLENTLDEKVRWTCWQDAQRLFNKSIMLDGKTIEEALEAISK